METHQSPSEVTSGKCPTKQHGQPSSLQIQQTQRHLALAVTIRTYSATKPKEEGGVTSSSAIPANCLAVNHSRVRIKQEPGNTQFRPPGAEPHSFAAVVMMCGRKCHASSLLMEKMEAGETEKMNLFAVLALYREKSRPHDPDFLTFQVDLGIYAFISEDPSRHPHQAPQRPLFYRAL